MGRSKMGSDIVTPIGAKAGAGWLQKALGYVVTRLSLVNRAGWTTDDNAAGESVNPSSVLGLSTAWACVNLIAGVHGTLPFEVWRINPRTGFPERAEGHWLNALLAAPNLEQTRIDLLEFVSTSIELRGSGFVRKGRVVEGGSLVSLTPLDPDLVYVSRRRDNSALEYRCLNWRGEVEVLGPADVWHIRGFGGNPLGGMSTLSYGCQAFGHSIALQKAASAVFKNGLQPSGVISYSDWLTEPRRQQAHAQIDTLRGSRNAGKPLVLEGGMQWTSLSFKPEEAQMLQAQSFSVEDICRWFGTPPVLVGHTEKVSSWGTGIGEITLGWLKFGLRRRFKRMEASADQQLLTAADRAAGYYLRYNIDALLRADSKGRAAFYEVMTRAGIMTINECRKLEGLPPVPGGDVPRMQSQNVPIGAAIGMVALPSGDEQ
ncbi:MAG: phage portal protein [Hyphomicrobiaceae bacterium]|nr:phage portal protein [Hyphomicrobiaceae bacterium]